MVFLGILLISWSMIFCGTYYYPTIIFPHFMNRKMNTKIRYTKTNITSDNDQKEISISSIIKPHDKRFMLFSIRAMQDSSIDKRKLMKFLCEESRLGHFSISNHNCKHNFIDADN